MITLFGKQAEMGNSRYLGFAAQRAVKWVFVELTPVATAPPVGIQANGR
jgi:hypothetical protein